MRTSQLEQAAAFAQARCDELAPLRAQAVRLVREFVAREAVSRLTEASLTRIRESLVSEDICRLARTLRTHATALAQGRASEPYWQLIDALNFLSDATGAVWPYFDFDDRDRYLAFARSYLDALEVSLGLDVTASTSLH